MGGLPAEETVSKSWTLGLASALMVALGYPGEIQSNPSGRWMWWFFAMIPFLYVVAELAVGLSEASQKLATTHGASVASLTGYSVADVVAKAVFGVLIWAIAAEKSKV